MPYMSFVRGWACRSVGLRSFIPSMPNTMLLRRDMLPSFAPIWNAASNCCAETDVMSAFGGTTEKHSFPVRA